MTVDLGDLDKERFFGEVTLIFQDGQLVLIRKTETIKPILNKTLDFSTIVVLR